MLSEPAVAVAWMPATSAAGSRWGLTASIAAAVLATTGAAKEVPEKRMTIPPGALTVTPSPGA